MNTTGFVGTSFPNRQASVCVYMEGHLSSCDVSLCIFAFFTAGSDMVVVLVLIVNPKSRFVSMGSGLISAHWLRIPAMPTAR